MIGFGGRFFAGLILEYVVQGALGFLGEYFDGAVEFAIHPAVVHALDFVEFDLHIARLVFQVRTAGVQLDNRLAGVLVEVLDRKSVV